MKIKNTKKTTKEVAKVDQKSDIKDSLSAKLSYKIDIFDLKEEFIVAKSRKFYFKKKDCEYCLELSRLSDELLEAKKISQSEYQILKYYEIGGKKCNNSGIKSTADFDLKDDFDPDLINFFLPNFYTFASKELWKIDFKFEIVARRFLVFDECVESLGSKADAIEARESFIEMSKALPKIYQQFKKVC